MRLSATNKNKTNSPALPFVSHCVVLYHSKLVGYAFMMITGFFSHFSINFSGVVSKSSKDSPLFLISSRRLYHLIFPD